MASITIKINSVSGVTCTLFGSKSTANDTDFSWDSSTNTATFTSSGSSSGPDISYLPFIDYSSGSPIDKRYNNSVALNLQWATGAQTVVLSGNVQSATWYINGTNILPSANTHYFSSAGASLTVTPVKASTSVTTADYVSKVTIGGYWRTNYGGVDGSQAGDVPPTGVFNSPVKWAAKHNNTQTTRRVPISWNTPASASASKIQYYIVVGWKGNWGSNLDVATSFLCSPNASSVLDITNWWDGAETIDGGNPGKLLYTVHALYSDKGVVPSLEAGQSHNVARTTPDWGIWRAFADHGETLVTLRFYDYNNGGTPSLIRDATTGDTEFTALKNKSLISSYIPTSGFPQVDGKYYIADAFSKNNRDSRPLANPNLSESALGKATGDLDIAIKLVPPTVNITFKSNYPSGTTGGGTADRVQNWMPGSVQQLLSEPNPPTKTGYTYTFNGWWTNASSGTKVGDAGQNYTVPNSAIALWAHWEETVISYDIKYSPDGRDPSTIISLPYGTYVTINNNGGSGDSSFTVNSNKTIRNPVKDDYVFAGYDYSNNTFTARWIPFWDWDDETLVFLAYKRPKLNISVKRDSLQNPDQVVMLEKPTLCPLLNKQGEDRNYVSSTSKVKYREEDRQDKTWSSEATRCYESRTSYGNPEYPTWQNRVGENTPLQNDKNSPFRTDLMSDQAKTKRLSLDIDKEWQVRAKIYDALGATSSYTHTTTGTKTLDSGDEYSTQSPYSNIALLLKYVTKLFVHNPFMDEVIKERRDGKDHRELSSPPETDYWQIREHTQGSQNQVNEMQVNALHSLLMLRSDSNSVNGFTRSLIGNYLIPTLERELVENEFLVYDYSQAQKLISILDKINSDHPKTKDQVGEFGLSGTTYNNQYEELEVGSYDPSKKYLQRIIDLDGERHTTASTTYTAESDNLKNRVRDTGFQKVKLANFNDNQVKKNPNAENDEAATTIDHISNYDISSVDLQRSLSDLIYILSRMMPRQEGSEGASITEVTPTSAITTALNAAVDAEMAYKADPTSLDKLTAWEAAKETYITKLGTYYDPNTETNLSDSVVTNWKPSNNSWITPENDIQEYENAALPGTDYGIFRDSTGFDNNGCKATCMGLCHNSCYSSCVGGCKTACGTTCFVTCKDRCSTTCSGVCSGTCSTGCGGDCSKTCTGACGNNCTGGCIGTCETTCTGGCKDGCKNGCKNSCTGGCTGQCGQSNCTGTCSKVCQESCNNDCSGKCGTTCSNVCQGNCGDTCQGTCLGGCDNTCTGGCKGDCTQTCDSNCGSSCNKECSSGCGGGCSKNCASSCYDSCTTTCTDRCQGSCGKACMSGCGNNCSNKCSADCSSDCFNGCSAFCNSTCHNQCTRYCTSACSGICSTACKDVCSMSCQDDCENNCRATCADTCSANCLNSCIGGCSSSCTQQCGGGCTGLCMRQCTTTCIEDCSGTCLNGCKNSCSNTCSDNCSSTCGGNCGANCSGTCGYNCWSTCGQNCGGGCNSQCTSGCFNLCKNSCKNTANI